MEIAQSVVRIIELEGSRTRKIWLLAAISSWFSTPYDSLSLFLSPFFELAISLPSIRPYSFTRSNPFDSHSSKKFLRFETERLAGTWPGIYLRLFHSRSHPSLPGNVHAFYPLARNPFPLVSLSITPLMHTPVVSTSIPNARLRFFLERILPLSFFLSFSRNA